MTTPASDQTIRTVAEAIFASGPVTVIEANSAFGEEPLEFHSAETLFAYSGAMRLSGANVHLAIHYADMSGALSRRRIDVKPTNGDECTYRYTAEGWGLIFVYLSMAPTCRIDSFISANSEKRALTWASTYPELDLPSLWNWPAVARHLRRLRRALKLVA